MSTIWPPSTDTRDVFGQRFQAVQAMLQDVTDPVRLIALSAHVGRVIYEGERAELGLFRGSSAFSPALRKLEHEFETICFDMQEERLKRLVDQCLQKNGLTFADARRILWMYTSRDVYRMLMREGGWSPDHYQEWHSHTLLEALMAPLPGTGTQRTRTEATVAWLRIQLTRWPTPSTEEM